MHEEWAEYVRVNVEHYEAGDPIVQDDSLTIFLNEDEEPLILHPDTMQDWWKLGYDDDGKEAWIVTESVTGVELHPIGAMMLDYNLNSFGLVITWIYDDHIKDIRSLATHHKRTEFMTEWHCETGKTQGTWQGPGYPYNRWWLAKILLPDEEPELCPDCKGEGRVFSTDADGMVFDMDLCETCDHTGIVEEPE